MISIPRKSTSRRWFLRGAGASVALPLLESLTTGPARAQGASNAFVLIMRQGCGVQQANGQHGIVGGAEPERFWPTALGPVTTESLAAAPERATSELAAHAQHLLFVRGIRLPYPGYTCAHANSGNEILTAAPFSGSGNTTRSTLESIDNRIARELTPGTDPLTLFAGPKLGYIDDILSYRENGDLRAGEQNPFNAYRRLFGMPTQDDAAELLFQSRKSVNDVVRQELQSLLGRTELSRADRLRLEQHFDAIRDLEVQMSCALGGDEYAQLSSIMDQQVENDDNMDLLVKLHVQVMVLAAACGLAPAATLQIGNGTDGVQYTVNGVKQPRFHQISHRIFGDGAEGDPIPDAVLKHHQIDRLFQRWFGYMIERMQQHTTPQGTLLDSGLAIWLNDMATGDHKFENVPFIFAGSLGGAFKQGQYVDADCTNNKVWNSVGGALGLKSSNGEPLEDFGGADLEKGRAAALHV